MKKLTLKNSGNEKNTCGGYPFMIPRNNVSLLEENAGMRLYTILFSTPVHLNFGRASRSSHEYQQFFYRAPRASMYLCCFLASLFQLFQLTLLNLVQVPLWNLNNAFYWHLLHFPNEIYVADYVRLWVIDKNMETLFWGDGTGDGDMGHPRG